MRKFSVLKLIGFLLAAGALAYKIVFAVYYFDDITDWWGGMIVLYFLFYLTSLAACASAFMKGTASLVTALVVACVSGVFLFGDGIAFLGFAASLSKSTMTELGIMPLVNIINMIACTLISIGARKAVSRKQEM